MFIVFFVWLHDMIIPFGYALIYSLQVIMDSVCGSLLDRLFGCMTWLYLILTYLHLDFTVLLDRLQLEHHIYVRFVITCVLVCASICESAVKHWMKEGLISQPLSPWDIGRSKFQKVNNSYTIK